MNYHLCILLLHIYPVGKVGANVGTVVRSPTTNNRYFISSDLLSFTEAAEACASMRGYLLEVEDEAEHTYITSLLTADNYWIGLEVDTELKAWWIQGGGKPGPWFSWNSVLRVGDDGGKYIRRYGTYKLDGREGDINYNYICEIIIRNYTCSTATIQPTQTVKVPSTLPCEIQMSTETSKVKQHCSNIPSYVTHTAENTITQTVFVTETETISVYAQMASTTGTSSSYVLQETDLERLVSELQVEKKATNSYMRTLISADDSRPSVKIVGWAGFGFLLIVSFIVLFIDLCRVFQLNLRHVRE